MGQVGQMCAEYSTDTRCGQYFIQPRSIGGDMKTAGGGAGGGGGDTPYGREIRRGKGIYPLLG